MYIYVCVKHISYICLFPFDNNRSLLHIKFQSIVADTTLVEDSWNFRMNWAKNKRCLFFHSNLSIPYMQCTLWTYIKVLWYQWTNFLSLSNIVRSFCAILTNHADQPEVFIYTVKSFRNIEVWIKLHWVSRLKWSELCLFN